MTNEESSKHIFEHVHVPIRMVDAPKIDENEDGGS